MAGPPRDPPGDDLGGLYLHVPFCSSVCPYCDFAVTLAGDDRRQAYVEAVVAEARLAQWTGPAFDTVYLGGGTPSSLEPEQIATILAGVRDALPVIPGARISLEVNPEDVTVERLEAWRSLGVAVVSLGLQSLEDRDLRFLGRRHQAAAGRRALELVASAGFETVAADLIFGLPDQRGPSWRRQLEEIVHRGVTHLSCYQLTIHEDTVFGRRRASGRLHEAPNELQAELFSVADEVLGTVGWDHYEVSNWAAAPRHQSRHNRKYWRHVPYLGLGPSAHSFRGRRRWWNLRKLRLWQRAVAGGRRPIDGEELLGRDELALERVMLGLRTSRGVDLDELERGFGIHLVRDNERLLDRYMREGLVWRSGSRLGPTAAGMAVAEGLVRSLELTPSATRGAANP
jgi:oxygen-independent coproporphyrinogen-3 oxidase